jgi:hypothetical protein
MKNAWKTRATLVAFLVVQAGLAQADEAADRCGSSKMKATGKYGQTVLKCHSLAARKNETVDPECLSKASGKLASSFDKAETVGGCVTSDDEGTVSSSLSTDADAIVLDLAPADTDEARACASSKMKAAGKQIGSILKCYATAAKNSERRLHDDRRRRGDRYGRRERGRGAGRGALARLRRFDRWSHAAMRSRQRPGLPGPLQRDLHVRVPSGLR